MKKQREFSLVVRYTGHDKKIDKRIENAVKRPAIGSGYFFMTAERDMEFRFKVEHYARKAIERVRNEAKKLPDWKIQAKLQEITA